MRRGDFMPKLSILPVLTLMFFSSIGVSKEIEFTPYIMKQGDTVNQILLDHNIRPLYGSAEWEEKVLKLNRLTKSSAKKIEPGDVIILPVASHYFSKDEIAQTIVSKDEISSMLASWKLSIHQKRMLPKAHNLTIWGEYFNRLSEYKNSGNSVRLNQNFAASIDYRYRDPISDRDVTLNPILSVGVYSQANANFSNNPNLTAEFTPSARARIGVEVEQRSWLTSLIPFVDYEYFSYVDYDPSTSYQIRKDQLLWIGTQIKKNFQLGSFSPYLGIEGATSIAGANEKSLRLSQSLDGSKGRAFIGTSFKRNYNLEIYSEQQNLKDSNEFSVKSTGLRLGYLF